MNFLGNSKRYVQLIQGKFFFLKTSFSNKSNFKRFFHYSKNFNEKVTVKVPPLAESITEGDVKSVLKTKGQFVEQDEVVLILETDKISIEVKSPNFGKISECYVEEGNTVGVDQNLFLIDTDEKEIKVNKPNNEIQENVKNIETPIVEEKKISLTKETLVEKKIQNNNETRVKMTRMRCRISERLKESQNTNAMLTTFNEVDMSSIIEVRQKYKELFEKKHKIKLGFMSIFLASSVAALKDQPIVNAVIDGNDIVYRDYIDISVAVASPTGLVVPVLRSVNNFNFVDFEKSLSVLANKAKTGSLAIEDMAGGTFTISNGGVFGSLMGTPIINMPQSAILGMHAINERPVAINGKVEIRPMMYVALTYDHRLIDGREAVTFLKKIKENVEDPIRFCLDL